MRTLSFFLFLALCLHTAGGQTLPGYVTIQNSGKAAGKDKPLSAHPASVLAKGAATDADVRPEDGGFELFFDGKKPGHDVEISVVKPGYEVVNHEDLVARLPDPASGAPAVRIYLCPQGEWRRYADQYYETNQRDLRDRYDRRIREAEQRLAAAGNAGRALADSVNRLIRERDEALVLLKGYAEQFARVNLDDVTERYRTAFRYFAAGKLDSFLLAANEKAIRADLDRVEAEIKRAKALGKTGRDKVAAGEALRQQTLQELLIRARALALNSRWDEADRTLGIVAAEDSTNHAIQSEYFRFKTDRKRHHEALNIAERMLRLSKHLLDSLNWINGIGTTHTSLGEYDAALKYFEWELELLKRNRNLVFKATVGQANCLSAMSRIYHFKGDFQKAERLADESLSMNERAARIDKQVAQYFFPNQLLDLGDLYQEYANYPKAEATFKRALEAKRSAVDTTTQEFRDWSADAKLRFVPLYFRTNRLQEALSISQELVDYCRDMAKKDPLIHTTAYVTALKHLVLNLMNLGEADMASQYLALADSLLQHGPIPPGNEILRDDIVSIKTYNDLNSGRDSLAFSSAEASFNYCRNLLQRDSLVFGDRLIRAYTTLMLVNLKLNKEEDNVMPYEECLALARSLQRMQPQKYTKTLADVLKTAPLPSSKRDPALLEEAEVLYQQLVLENPDKYASALASCQSELGSSALYRRDTASALKYYEKAWATLSQYSANKQSLTGSASDLSGVLIALGRLYFDRDPARADSCFRQGLEHANRLVQFQSAQLCRYLNEYGTFKANYGSLSDAIALLSESRMQFKKLPPEDFWYAFTFHSFQLNQHLLGDMYFLDGQPEKSLAAHREAILESNVPQKTAKRPRGREETIRLFAQMDAGNTDSLITGLDTLLADSLDVIFYRLYYHFGIYLLEAGELRKAKAVFRKTNAYCQAWLNAESSAFGLFHTRVMSSLLSAETARAAALQYAESGKDTRRTEALDLLDTAEKSLRSVPDSTPGRAMVAAKIAELRAELKN